MSTQDYPLPRRRRQSTIFFVSRKKILCDASMRPRRRDQPGGRSGNASIAASNCTGRCNGATCPTPGRIVSVAAGIRHDEIRRMFGTDELMAIALHDRDRHGDRREIGGVKFGCVCIVSPTVAANTSRPGVADSRA
ncbi:hypothetical protein K8O94_26740 [Burkholderia dolosa]|uniref:Uncharacterized protein n=1 Tax=Burkholderia dolosa TaxID=152500 RepID=A0A892IJI3_9BURK|nr:hypothetical protein I6K02_28160 [Burkholderia dolosa]UAK67122.1 hypothetical protein K8O94_26740 [Burkholderia dolosa]